MRAKKIEIENKLVYIFINEEIYILCLLMHSFSYKKLFSVFAASHTNSQCKYDGHCSCWVEIFYEKKCFYDVYIMHIIRFVFLI